VRIGKYMELELDLEGTRGKEAQEMCEKLWRTRSSRIRIDRVN
jgi:phosphoribosylformylglycinamidine (FGAM) synthase PurS component